MGRGDLKVLFQKNRLFKLDGCKLELLILLSDRMEGVVEGRFSHLLPEWNWVYFYDGLFRAAWKENVLVAVSFVFDVIDSVSAGHELGLRDEESRGRGSMSALTVSAQPNGIDDSHVLVVFPHLKLILRSHGL